MTDLEEAIVRYVCEEIRKKGDLEYCQDCIVITDPYNLLVCHAGTGVTDESRRIYRLVDLCMLDEDMHWVPNMNFIRRIAGSF